jgi:hypothetical protein
MSTSEATGSGSGWAGAKEGSIGGGGLDDVVELSSAGAPPASEGEGDQQGASLMPQPAASECGNKMLWTDMILISRNRSPHSQQHRRPPGARRQRSCLCRSKRSWQIFRCVG